ncbi:peptidoglycan endopeptidase [Bacillus sp. B15-48]|uniref:C40 family peptidase n=1 Tax=Bacillus sp. B15-48 TaxID=1548601 RepID=UPI00193F8592|nr:peptidoglycan endopeptidase [Bacillus sp. B15-48]MBM4761474.1 LysM peptidoglycan-binding domain-containing protein [Bacillus sp. B15-48]
MKKQVTTIAAAAILSSAFASTAFADTYTVKRGDTLYHIARNHSTTVNNLKTLNGLSSERIYPNQKLAISQQAGSTGTSSSSVSTLAATATPISTVHTYTIVSGDTLSGIAQKHNISLSNLRSWNNLTSDLIFPGQTLIVSSGAGIVINAGSGAGTGTNVGSGTGSSTAPAPAASSTTTYTVVRGDTLSTIAQRHQISLSNLRSWNNLTSDLIFPGQTLAVSSSANNGTSAGSGSGTGTGASSGAATSPAPANGVYTIKPGDTLGKIASQFNMTVSALRSLNQMSSDLIYAGQTLNVSGQAVTENAPAPTPASAPATGFSVERLISEAKALIGTPYLWGGTSPSGFDCSGYIHYVFNKAGQSLVRTSAEGYYNRSYYVNTPQPGDLVFFENTYKKGISHLGIYIGNNEFIHADSSGVRITSLNDSYYSRHFESFKRFY